MSVARRKAHAVRAPSSLRYEAIKAGEGSGSSSSSSSALKGDDGRHAAKQKAMLAINAAQTYHAQPPAIFSSPALQTLIYATSNDRYPGAPGTLLHRAKLEAARALAASKREAQREAERRDEMKRLGILSVGGNRKRGNGHGGATDAGSNGNGTGRSSRFNTPPGAERARRSAAATTTVASAAAANGTINGLPNGTTSTSNGNNSGSRRAPVNGSRHHPGNAIDHNSLPVPGGAGASQHQHNHQPQPSSPLLSSSGRLRRPANGSRGASPMPLTGPPGPRGTRSPIVAQMELDEADRAAGAGGGDLIDPVVVPAN